MKQLLKVLVVITVMASFIIGCAGKEANNDVKKDSGKETQQATAEDQGKEAKAETKETTETTAVVGETNEDKAQAANSEKKQLAPTKQQTNTVNQQAVKSNATMETKEQTKKEESPSLVQEKSSVSKSNNQPVASPKVEQIKTSTSHEQEITISIKGDEQTGLILKPTKITFDAGDTVLDLLKKATKQNRIQMEYQGSGGTAYIEGINNLYEFDKGPKSGWMYSINGVFMKKGAGLAEVKEGDKIAWVYTLNLGKDIGASVNE